jgi:hypothetical protein
MFTIEGVSMPSLRPSATCFHWLSKSLLIFAFPWMAGCDSGGGGQVTGLSVAQEMSVVSAEEGGAIGVVQG